MITKAVFLEKAVRLWAAGLEGKWARKGVLRVGVCQVKFTQHHFSSFLQGTMECRLYLRASQPTARKLGLHACAASIRRRLGVLRHLQLSFTMLQDESEWYEFSPAKKGCKFWLLKQKHTKMGQGYPPMNPVRYGRALTLLSIKSFLRVDFLGYTCDPVMTPVNSYLQIWGDGIHWSRSNVCPSPFFHPWHVILRSFLCCGQYW